MIDLMLQRSAELIYHDRALRHEFSDWRAQAAGPDKPFAKHQSQIGRITGLLEAFLDTIDAANVAVAFEPQEAAYSHLLGIYRIWSYFRSKLIMRADNRLADILRCADELAWQCYEPARQQAKAAGVLDVEGLKEPPLVFFSSDATPFAQARTTPFMPEGLSDRDIVDFAELILSLPIPVIGVPWFQLNHLPAIPVVAHEVGHAVELDFAITTPLQRLFAGLDIEAGRREAWVQWRQEIFADVYACICMGPAFVLGLVDYLLGAEQEVQKEERQPGKWGIYPTRTLRILINLETLDQLGLLATQGEPPDLDPFLAALRQVWRTTYPQHRMQPFEDDIKAVVSALLGAKFDVFGEVALRDIVSYGHAQLVYGWYLSEDVLAKSDFPADAKDWSFRVLAGAPALAYGLDPQGYNQNNAEAVVLASLLRTIPEGVRAADPEDDDLTARKEIADRKVGQTLGSFFSK